MHTFSINNFTYIINEISCSNKIAKVLVEATRNGKVYRKDPVYGIGSNPKEAIYKAYSRLVESTVITNNTQLEFVFYIGEIMANLKSATIDSTTLKRRSANGVLTEEEMAVVQKRVNKMKLVR